MRWAAFWRCQQSSQTPVSLLYEASPVELREKLPGEKEGRGGGGGGGGDGKEKNSIRLRNALFLKLAILRDELSGSEV